MYNKSFIEILGDWLDKGWKRVILCYLLLAASGGLGMIFPPALILGFVFISVMFSFKRRDEISIEKIINNPIELSNVLFSDDVSQISFLGLNNEFLERILRFNIRNMVYRNTGGGIIYLVDKSNKKSIYKSQSKP